MDSVLSMRRIISYVVVILICTNLILSLGTIYSDYLERELISAALAGDVVTEEEADENDSRQRVLALASVPFFLAEFVVFLIWVSRANKSLRVLGVDGLEFTPGWAAGWFVIPIANLFKPIQVMQEIWQGSNPDTTNATGRDWHYTSNSGLLRVWWTFVIASIILSRIYAAYLPIGGVDTTMDRLIGANTLSIISEALVMGRSLLGLYLVVLIERRLQRKEEIRSLADHFPEDEAPSSVSAQ